MSKTRLQQWDDLKREWADCRLCPLHERRIADDRRKLVFGEADKDKSADLMFVGEGPGKYEEREGVPFYGESGGVIEGLLEAIKYPLEKVALVNAVCCRSCDEYEDDGQMKEVDKKPRTGALEACRARLYKQIYIVDPLVIVALGATALQTLAGRQAKLSKLLGEVVTITVPGQTFTPRVVERGRGKAKKMEVVRDPIQLNYPCVATYHPAFLLRNQSLEDTSPESPGFKVLKHMDEVADTIRAYLKIEGRRAT